MAARSPVVALLVCAALTWAGGSGCVESCYLLQAAYGQDELAYRARPLPEVLQDEAVPAQVRALLSVVDDAARFGAAFGLTPTDNYREYVDLDRDAVVWVVSAAPPLGFEPKTWWFPIVGSVPYLGWFDLRDAERQAARLAADGWDVDLRPATAYSTLGWFDDPILSTMIRDREGVEGDLVEVVLHESVHATHYLPSQTYFNESLANFVAERLTARYLRERLALDRWRLLAYEQGVAAGRRRAERLHQTHLMLAALYATDAPVEVKLALKRQALTALQRELGFERPITNATVAQSRQYHGGEALFAELLAHCGDDWARFWETVRGIDVGAFAVEQQEALEPVLDAVLGRTCPG